MSSSKTTKNKQWSDWETAPNTLNTAKTVSNVASGGVHSMYLQLFGVIGVLLVFVVIAVPIAYTLSATTETTTSAITNVIVKTTVTINPYACGNMTVLLDTDLPSNNLVTIGSTNYTECCKSCLTTVGCIGFSFTSGGACYRKSSLGTGPITGVPNVISAFY